MLRDIRLLLLPGTLDILHWSVDGQLAVLTNEDVVILVPKFAYIAGSKTMQQFDHATANLRQLILQQMDDYISPASSYIYSVGEEQTAGFAKQVAWSPSGVSRFRRCMLAVLATNCYVHIFEPYDNPAGNWQVRYNLMSHMNDYKSWKNKKSDRITDRLRSRAQAISWSPPCRYTTSSQWGDSVLAVANDNLEIVLFSVTREKAQVIGDISPYGEDEVAAHIGKRPTFLTHLSWSPWVDSGDGKGHAYLSYAHVGRVFITKVAISAASKGDSAMLEMCSGHRKCVGKSISDRHPIHSVLWAPEEINGYLVLAYSVQHRVSIVAIDKDGEFMTKEDLTNGFIETTAGFTFSPAKTSQSVILHLVTMKGKSQVIEFSPSSQSSGNSKATTKSIVNAGTDIDIATQGIEDNELKARASHWPLVVESRKIDFMGENDLSTAVARVYGLASSPLGGVIAVACSYHPVGMLQYITYARERMTISFGTHDGSGRPWQQYTIDPEAKRIPSPVNIASEATILEAVALRDIFRHSKKLLENSDKFGDAWDFDELHRSLHAKKSSLSSILHSPPLNAIRYKICMDASETKRMPDSTVSPDSPEIIAHAVLCVLATPWSTECVASPMSKGIVYSLAAIGTLAFSNNERILKLAQQSFVWLNENTPDMVTFVKELEIIDTYLLQARQRASIPGERLESQRNSKPGPIVFSSITSTLVTCCLCRAGMVWEDMRVAECTNGHRFSRCAMTFLPIQRPEMTRECVVCGRIVLGKELLVADREGIVLPEGVKTVAETVFDEWDCCLQCGGKYWSKGH